MDKFPGRKSRKSGFGPTMNFELVADVHPELD